MDVSILICTCNRADHLRETLHSLAEVETPAGAQCELVVIDNASTDNTRDIVTHAHLPNMPVRYVQEERRGQSNARNSGIAASQGSIILFTDDDLRFPRNWIETMCRPFFSENAHAVSGKVKIAPHLERRWMEPMHRAWLAENDHDNPYLRDTMVGANMAFDKSVLKQAPSFDTELGPGALGFADDSLFARQLQEAGYAIKQAQSVVEHHFDAARLTRASFLDSAKKHGRTSAYVMHHWEHQTVRFAKLNLIRKRLQLALWRRTHAPECAGGESVSQTEMHHVRSLHLYQQYLIERQRPRHYERHGLRKLL